MSEGLRSELTNMIGPTQWEWLKPHISRDAVIMVDSQLDLVEVGVALATDNVQTVQRWIGEALLTKPTRELLETWDRQGCGTLTSLIVQPYVLVQEPSAASHS